MISRFMIWELGNGLAAMNGRVRPSCIDQKHEERLSELLASPLLRRFLGGISMVHDMRRRTPRSSHANAILLLKLADGVEVEEIAHLDVQYGGEALDIF